MCFGHAVATPAGARLAYASRVVLHIARNDDSLAALLNVDIASSLSAGVTYRVERLLGGGGMSVALHAVRRAPEGRTPCVLKVLRPSFVEESGPTATLAVQKEAVALGRLNERVPSTPFVVRLLDTGALTVDYDGRPLDLAWLAVEYVNGGPDGTTLQARVANAMRAAGIAFGAERAARAIDALAKGLAAVHEVGIIHRDIKPDNILCCGSGADEVFKVADFGIARPAGMAATFGGLFVGTPGYAPAELMSLDEQRVGPWTDVFAFAAVVFYLLTGEDYFDASSIVGAIDSLRSPARRSILEGRALSPELRARPGVCNAIDALLAQATALSFKQRPPSAVAFATPLLACLRPPARSVRPPPSSHTDALSVTVPRFDEWNWITRWRSSQGDLVVRQVAAATRRAADRTFSVRTHVLRDEGADPAIVRRGWNLGRTANVRCSRSFGTSRPNGWRRWRTSWISCALAPAIARRLARSRSAPRRRSRRSGTIPTTRSMTRFDFGDVVLVAFPFSDRRTTKKRPAVVLSSEAYQRERPDVVVMAVTSRIRTPPAFGERSSNTGSRLAC